MLREIARDCETRRGTTRSASCVTAKVARFCVGRLPSGTTRLVAAAGVLEVVRRVRTARQLREIGADDARINGIAVAAARAPDACDIGRDRRRRVIRCRLEHGSVPAGGASQGPRSWTGDRRREIISLRGIRREGRGVGLEQRCPASDSPDVSTMGRQPRQQSSQRRATRSSA